MERLFDRWRPVLLAALVFVMAPGCSENPAIRMRYEAEKRFEVAQRALDRLRINPNLTAPQMQAEVQEQFEGAISYSLQALEDLDRRQYPVEYRELVHIAFMGTSRLAEMLYTTGQLGGAIVALDRLLQQPDLQPEQALATRISLGRSLQAAARWDSALAVYNTAIETYYPPLDRKGEVLYALFNLPAHIFRITNIIGDTVSASYELERAVSYYRDLADDYGGTPLGPAARINLAGLYRATGQWQRAITELEAMSDPASENYESVRIQLGDIYLEHLDQPDRAEAIYRELLAEADPEADTMLYPMLRFKMASLALVRGKYDEAREILNDLKQNFRRWYGTFPPAQFAMARSFELDNNWGRAEVEFNYLIENYRGADQAMAAFLYVAERLKEMGREGEAERWYEDAREYYQEVAAMGEGTVLEAKAMAYRAEMASSQGNWEEAAEIMTAMFEKFPRTEPGRRAVAKAAQIYREELDRPAVADSLIEALRAAITDIKSAGEL